MKIHHIGYLVKSIEKALPSFESLGFIPQGENVYDEIRDIDILFMNNEGYCIELVEPKSEKSVAWNLLKKMGVTPYHICYFSTDFEKDMDELRAAKFVPMGEPLPAPALGNKRVVFMFSRHSGIIELIEA